MPHPRVIRSRVAQARQSKVDELGEIFSILEIDAPDLADPKFSNQVRRRPDVLGMHQTETEVKALRLIRKRLEELGVDASGMELEAHRIEDVRGVGPAMQRKLATAGVVTLEDLRDAPPSYLAENVSGLSEAKAVELIENASGDPQANEDGRDYERYPETEEAPPAEGTPEATVIPPAEGTEGEAGDQSASGAAREPDRGDKPGETDVTVEPEAGGEDGGEAGEGGDLAPPGEPLGAPSDPVNLDPEDTPGDDPGEPDVEVAPPAEDSDNG